MPSLSIFFFAFIFLAHVYANHFTPIQGGPLHEAFVVQEFNTLFLEAVPNPPPPDLVELVPKIEDAGKIWIPGYWSWSYKHGNFLWVTGTWRKPPPDYHWISGYWKQNEEFEWVWIRGFWSKLKKEAFVFFADPPPDSINENVNEPVNGEVFWVPGHWEYNFQNHRYTWYCGTWIALQSDWVYVPPRVVWRDKGYIFNPAFWDWPLDQRGIAYTSVGVSQSAIKDFNYEPSDILNNDSILQLLFLEWPNYTCLFNHYYFMSGQNLSSWGAPPWWNWPTWWSFSWLDSWWLWWWWTHPGYPNPDWIDGNIAKIMIAAPLFLKKVKNEIKPPVNLTPNGCVRTQKILETMKIITGKKTPILPTDPKQVLQIQNFAKPQAPNPPYLSPLASEKMVENVPKPFRTVKFSDLEFQKTVLPPIPNIKSAHILPEKIEELESSSNESDPIDSDKLNDSNQCTSLFHFYENYYERLYDPPYHKNSLHGKRRKMPMQTEHHDFIMSHPQYQRNPEGPKVYPTPGDLSTLPED